MTIQEMWAANEFEHAL